MRLRRDTSWPRFVIALGMLLASAGTAHANSPPVVDSLTATPSSAAPGQTVAIKINAHDPDCPGTCTSGCGLTIRSDLLSWTDDTARGSTAFSNDLRDPTGSPWSATVDWLAPTTEGTYTIQAYVADSGGFACGGRASVTQTLSITVSTIPPPVIDSLTASPAQILTGDTATLKCSATDPTGGTITYGWSAAGGIVTDEGLGTATFASNTPGITPVTCTATSTSGVSSSKTVNVSTTDAIAEAAMTEGLIAPERVAVDDLGSVYVVDRAGGGIQVLSLGTGALIYRIPMPDATSVAVDWSGRLVIGRSDGAVITTPAGVILGTLVGPKLGPTSDVAVDRTSRRYAVLYRTTARAVIYDEAGAPIASFGSTGDAADQFKEPTGIAFTPSGDVVIADSGHGQIKVFSPDGTSLLNSFGAQGGSIGEFVRLDDVTVNADGVFFATDAFQSWVQSFNPDGTPREVLGTFGTGIGKLETPAGVDADDPFGRLVVASLNTSSVQVFRTDSSALAVPMPTASVSTNKIVFGVQIVGTTSPPQTVVLTNTGKGPLGIGTFTTTRGFESSSNCGAFLGSGASCTISVQFTPYGNLPYNGELTLETSASTDPVTVALFGNGFTEPGIVLSPWELQFPDQLVGTTSDARTITVSNSGSIPLQISRIETSGPYAYSSSCPAQLSGGQSCAVRIYFTPGQIADSLPGTLRVYSTAVGSPHAAALDGRGTAIDITPTPGEIDFGSSPVGATSSLRRISVTNTGTLPVQLGLVAIAGPQSGDFVLADDACSGKQLFLHQVCNVDVAFDPGFGGRRTANLVIPSDTTLAPDSVALQGTGTGGVAAIPAATPWGLLLLGALLAIAGWVKVSGGRIP